MNNNLQQILHWGRHSNSYQLGPIFILEDIRINEYISPPSIKQIRNIWSTLTITDEEIKNIVDDLYDQLTPYNSEIDECEFNYDRSLIDTFIQNLSNKNTTDE